MTFYLRPTPRPTDGLLDGYMDVIGGSPLEETVELVLTSNADGHIIISEADGGGRVTWVRGVWDLDVKFRYDSYMAPTEDPLAINYMPSNSGLSDELKPTATNLYVDGALFTRLIPRGEDPNTGAPVEILPNTPYQVRFNRRDGTVTLPGESVSGWPFLRVDPEFYGTAEDGDLYVLWAATIAAAAFNAPLYTALRDRLAAAQLAGSRPQGNRIPFDLPLNAEDGQTGLYEYFNEASPPATTFVGSISGTTLTVTSATGEIGPNHILSGTGVLADTYITDRLTGRGGTGTYRVNNDHTVPTGSVTITASAFTGTPFTWGVEPRTDGEHGRYLRVQTEVISGGPPYNYSGWGCWQTWAVNPASEPFLSFQFDFDGGGCGRNIGFSTNAQDDEPTANVECLIPCLPSAGGAFTAFELFPADLWRLNNVVLEARHKEPYWAGNNIDYGNSLLAATGWNCGQWPVYTNNWTIHVGSNELRHNSGSTYPVSHAYPIVAGVEYFVRVEVKRSTFSGNFSIAVGGHAFGPVAQSDCESGGGGTYWYYEKIITASSNESMTITPSSDFVTAIDAIAIVTDQSYSRLAMVELDNSIAASYEWKLNRSVVVTGDNKVVNGDFSSPLSGTWVNASGGDGTVTLIDGAAVMTYTSAPRARLRQAITVTAWKRYRVRFDLSITGGSSSEFLSIGTTSGGYDIANNLIGSIGENVFYFTAPASTVWLNFFAENSGWFYSLDNVEVKEVSGQVQTGSIDIGINTEVCDSTGTTSLLVDIESDVSDTVRIFIYDANGTSFYHDLSVVAGVRATHEIGWDDFIYFFGTPSTLTHPIDQINIRTLSSATGALILYGCWFDDIVTMADLSITAIGGFEFQFPSYDTGEPYDCKFDNVVLNIDIVDGPVADPQRYQSIPRWTYKWNFYDDQMAYGMWRGHSGVGYLWLAGWSEAGVINPDTGRDMARIQRDFMKDAQDTYIASFPAKHFNGTENVPGPFMPRYGRPSWEALNQEGAIPDGNGSAVFSSGTYNKWYFPWDDSLPDAQQYDADDWYGYTYRAVLSCASDYYRTLNATSKTILDRWIAWFNEGERTLTDAYTFTTDWPTRVGTYTGTTPTQYVIGIIKDGNYWRLPSGFLADGRVRYHYRPSYAWACVAQAMLFKYWTDGDADALKWARRLLEYLRSQQFVDGGTSNIGIRNADDTDDAYVDVTNGCLVIAQRIAEGSGYTTASVVIEGDGEGAVVLPRIVGGMVRSYAITSTGSGYTWIRGTVVGDGTGATVALELYEQVVGAFDLWHTGWEVWEIYNTFAMLVLGYEPGGTTNYPVEPLPEDVAALNRLQQFMERNTRDEYPMMVLANQIPMHEYGGWDPYHNGQGIENPMIRDTRARGATWTETTGPAFRASVYQRLHFGYDAMFNVLTNFHYELAGMTYDYPYDAFLCLDASPTDTPVLTPQTGWNPAPAPEPPLE